MTRFDGALRWLGGLRGAAILLMAACGLAGCAGGSSQAEKGSSTGNDELDRLLAVELPVDPGARHALPESLDYRGSLPFAYQHAGDGDVDRFDMVVGDSTNVISCYVFQEEVELGATAVRLAALGGSLLERQVAPFPRRRILQVFAGVADRQAYHGIAWLWADDKGFAEPKAVAGNAGGFGAACTHLGLGYQKTLVEILTHLMASLERSKPALEPYFEEVSVLEMGDLAIQLSRLRMFRDEEGDSEIRLETSTMIPTEATSIATTYGSTQSWARPDGSLINARAFESDLEESRTDLDLRIEGGRWRVKGTYQGKPIDRELDHRDPIDSTLSEYHWLTGRLRPHGDATTARLFEWVPDANPVAVVEATMNVDPGNPDRVELSMGPIRMQAERGDDGLIDRGTLALGSRPVSLRVIHRAGEL